MDGASGEVPCGSAVSYNVFPNVIDMPAIEPIPDPLADQFDGIEMNTTNSSFMFEQVVPIAESERLDAFPIEDTSVLIPQIEPHESIDLEPLLEFQPNNNNDSTALLSPATIDECINEIDQILESTPHTATSHTNPTNILDDSSFAIASSPFNAPTSNTLTHTEQGRSHIPQSLIIDAPSLNSPTPFLSAPPISELPASTIAPPQPEFLVPPVTSPIGSPPQTAQETLSRSALIQSQLVAGFGRHLAQRLGDMGRQLAKSKPPSRFCHVCVRPAARFGFLLCVNNTSGTCRKVVCKRCFEEFQWDWNAAANDPFWACSHCNGTCPERASCFTYNRSNKRRNPRRTSGSQQNKRSRTT